MAKRYDPPRRWTQPPQRASLTVAAVVLMLALAGCTSESDKPDATNSSAPSTNSGTSTSSATGDIEPAGALLPSECAELEPLPTAGAGGAGVIDAALRSVPLPPGVRLQGTHIVASGDSPWGVEVVIHTCSAGLTAEQFLELSTAYAAAVPSRAKESVDTMVSQMWIPDGSGSIEQGQTLRADNFQHVAWEQGVTSETRSAWAVAQQ